MDTLSIIALGKDKLSKRLKPVNTSGKIYVNIFQLLTESMPIESAKDLYVANGVDLRHWHDVSSDIIKYLKDKLNRAAEAVVYKGPLANMDAILAQTEDAMHGDVWTNEETGVNFMWNGEDWIPVSLFRVDFDKEPIEGSTNGIQSGYIWTALQNFIDDPTIYRIVEEAEGDPEFQNILLDVSNRLADIILDISDLRARIERIPDPMISEDEGNEIIKGSDAGLYYNSNNSKLAERVHNLEIVKPKEIETKVEPDGATIQMTSESPEITYLEAFGDLTFDFEILPKSQWMTKYIYVEAMANIALTFVNATFSDMSDQPSYGQAGYGIFIRCTWIAGKIILEVLDNSQETKNVEDYIIENESQLINP